MMDGALISRQIRSLSEEENGYVAVMANASALLNEALDDINWVGFYITRGEDLILGPFQGKVACVRIPHGRGVCGAAALRRETVVVDDVHAFPGHIACDSASRSEIVVPLMQRGAVVGVLDIDSPSLSRFSDEDRVQIERVAAAVAECARFDR